MDPVSPPPFWAAHNEFGGGGGGGGGKTRFKGLTKVTWCLQVGWRSFVVDAEPLRSCIRIEVEETGPITERDRFETCFKEWKMGEGCVIWRCHDPVSSFTYIVWQKGYFHLFPLAVGILSPLSLHYHVVNLVCSWISKYALTPSPNSLHWVIYECPHRSWRKYL